ncbi:MAG: tetratricopeptide repeat protein [Lachnospiraceae bacterium]|nr:tetratricopeptide repeat protein [Lachnospiraceae bacterium]
MGREPLPSGSKLICRNGDIYTIVGEPIGAGGSSIVYSAYQEGEDSQLAIKECYPVNGAYQRGALFYRKNGVVHTDTEEGKRHLQMLANRMCEEKAYSQKIYNRTICVVKMIRRLEVAMIQLGDGNDKGEEKNKAEECAVEGIFFLMDDIRWKSVSLPGIMEECQKEYAKGNLLRRGGLPSIHITAKVISEILSALHRIHTDQDLGGYLHGDIQENNIFFQNADLAQGSIGIACMLDLGCMQKLEEDGKTGVLDTTGLYGTPGYTSPEILFGGKDVRLGVQADIYSLGRLFLYMLTGQQYPQEGRDPVYYDSSLQRLLPSEGDKIGCSREVRKFVNQILERALDFQPENRYDSAAKMKRDMERLCEMTAPAKYHMAPNLPSLPTFTGRSRELEQLDELLTQGQNPIWIYGFGGMGKSELAIQFGLGQKKRGGKEVYRIMFQKSLTDTICEIRFIGGEAEENMPRDKRYRRNMDILSSCFKDCILIIDNMDEGQVIEAMQSKETEEFQNHGIGNILRDKAYQELIRQPFTVLFTTRYDLGAMGMAAVEVGPLAENEILEMMLLFYPGEEQKTVLKKIIHETGFHTLAAELVARTLQADRGTLTPEQLLLYLKEHRLKQYQMPQVISNRDREYRQETIYCHIQNLYKISSLGEAAKLALAHLLFLAPEGMERNLYLDCEDDKTGAGLTECLLPRGWVSCSLEGKLSVHPLIQELCMQELHGFLQREYFSDFLMRIKERCDRDNGEDYHSFFGLAGYLARTGNWFCDSSISRLGGEIFLRCRSGSRAQEILQNALEQCPEQDELEQSILYCDLCYTSSLVGNGAQACQYGMKAMEIRERFFSSESEEMALVFNNMGMAYELMGDYAKMLEYYQKALSVRKHLYKEDRVELAISNNNVGSAYEANGNLVQAISYYEEAVRLCRKIYQKVHPNLAIFCNNAGNCSMRLGDYSKGYQYLSEALEISRTLLPANHYTLIAIFLNMANLLEQRGDVGQGVEYVEEAVRRSESIEPTDWLLLAHSYYNYSYFLDRMGAYPLAVEYGERALEIRRRFFAEDHPALKDLYYNLKCLCIRMGETQRAAYYERKENAAFQKNKHFV